MKGLISLHTLMSVAYGVLLGSLLIIAICELIGGASGLAAFRYQAF